MKVSTILSPAVRPPEAFTPCPGPELKITVVFTSVHATLGALQHAAALANRLSARITLLVAQVVPYPLPLPNPSVPVEFSERRFRVLAGAGAVGTSVHICLCRDALEGIRAVLPPRSLVVIGGRRRWWPTRESRLAAGLRKAGHEVIFNESE